MPSMYASSGGPPDDPGGPIDPNTGTGSNRAFRGPHGPGSNIADPSNPSHLHLRNSNQVRLNRAQRGMVNPAAPHVKVSRPKAAAASARTPRSAGGHSVTNTSTKTVNASGTIIGGAFGGPATSSRGALALRGRIDSGLLLKLLEQTAIVAVNGEPIGIDSFGQFFPFGHKPTKMGKLRPDQLTPAPIIGQQIRASLVSYDAATRTATISTSTNPDGQTFGVPVAASVTDAQMAAANSVGLVQYSETDPTDAVITYTF